MLRFDIPLLIQKAVEHKIACPSELNKLWYNGLECNGSEVKLLTIDLFQILLPANRFKFKETKLEKIVEKLKEHGFNDIPEPFGSGEVNPRNTIR